MGEDAVGASVPIVWSGVGGAGVLVGDLWGCLVDNW